MSSYNTRGNQLIGRIQSSLERFIVLDTLLFAGLMLLKLYWFNRLLSVLYMDMTRKDLMIEAGAVLLVSFWCLWLPARARNLVLVLLNLALSLPPIDWPNTKLCSASTCTSTTLLPE